MLLIPVQSETLELFVILHTSPPLPLPHLGWPCSYTQLEESKQQSQEKESALHRQVELLNRMCRLHQVSCQHARRMALCNFFCFVDWIRAL